MNKEDHLEPGSSRTSRTLQTLGLLCWSHDRVSGNKQGIGESELPYLFYLVSLLHENV